MRPEHDTLIRRLDDFHIGPEQVQLDFISRLARDNDWTRDYAERVVKEYKRFLVIAMTAGHPVTPSEAVDQAWHLHLCYSKSYWHDLCNDILGRPFHHGPTEGGREEGAKFDDWYSKTLASYVEIFDDDPPTTIWPEPKERFKNADRFVRVNTAEKTVLPLSPKALRRCIFGALLLGISAVYSLSPESLPATVMVLIFLFLTPILTAAVIIGSDPTRVQYRSGGTESESGCGFVVGGIGDGCGGDHGCGGAGCGGGGCGGGGCGGCGGCGG